MAYGQVEEQQAATRLGAAATTLVLLLIGYLSLKTLYNIYFHPLAKISGPSTWSATRLPFVRSLLQGTLVHDVQKLHRRYGPVLRIGPDEVTFEHPDAWNDIFLPRPGHPQFLKDPTWWKPQPTLGLSLVSAINPETHARIRKQLEPGFTPRAVRDQEPFIQRYVNALVERLDEKAADEGEVNIEPWFNFTTFDIFGDLGFGESFNCLQQSRYHPWVALLFNSVKAGTFIAAAQYYPLIEYVLLKCIPPSLKKMQQDHYQQIVDKLQRRLNYELDRPDIVSHVTKPGKELPIGEMNTSFMELTIAGSETTATTLSGTMNYLVHEPDTLNKLMDEIRGHFQAESEIMLDALRDLPYLNAVLNEGLRLCPPVAWVLPRLVPPSGATVCGVALPGGTRVSVQAYSMNRDDKYFYRAESFLPERWLPGVSGDPTSPFFADRRDGFQPFILGSRACLGQNLAWAELRLILAKLVWNFDFGLPEDRAKWVRWEDLKTFVLVEKKPIYVTIRPRAEPQDL